MFVSSSAGSNVTAQSGYGSDSWSERERIRGIHDVANTPSMVVDGEGTVHAFHSQPVPADGSDWAIVYSKWIPGRGWTDPIDIILPINGNLIRVPSAFLDENGRMHLVFYCCVDVSPNIYYTNAWATNAGNAKEWSEPQLIGKDAKSPASAALVGDGTGKLVVIYSGISRGTGIDAISSLDGGTTWSEPSQVFRTFDESLLPFGPKLEPDDEGRIHAVWVINRADGNGDAIYYARLESDYITWSKPTLLASAAGDQVPAVTSASIVSYGDQISVVYLEWAPPRRLIRISTDGGQNWSEPSEFLRPTRGEYGPASFAVDGTNNLHVIMGDRGRSLTLWHSVLQDDGLWLEPEPIVPISEATKYPKGHHLEFHPTSPRLVISRGNILMLSWRLDFGHGNNGTWYSTTTLDIPERPVVPLPLALSTPVVISTREVEQILIEATQLPSTDVALEDDNSDIQARPVANGPYSLVFIALVPFVFLFLIVIFFQIIRRRHI